MIFIDSANIEEIKSALELGWVRGVTTNPILLAVEKCDPVSLFEDIRALCSGPVFYQMMSREIGEMRKEASRIAQILGGQLVLKIIPSETGFKFCSLYSGEFDICITAVFNPLQAVVAANSGAAYTAVYYNRAQKSMGDGSRLIKEISTVLSGLGTEILAASIKSVDEVKAVLNAGAYHIALPYPVIVQMIQDDLSDQAIESFFQNGVGIDGLDQT